MGRLREVSLPSLSGRPPNPRYRSTDTGANARERRWIALELASTAITAYYVSIDATALRKRKGLVERGSKLLKEFSEIVEGLNDVRFHDKDLVITLAGHPLAESARKWVPDKPHPAYPAGKA